MADQEYRTKLPKLTIALLAGSVIMLPGFVRASALDPLLDGQSVQIGDWTISAMISDTDDALMMRHSTLAHGLDPIAIECSPGGKYWLASMNPNPTYHVGPADIVSFGNGQRRIFHGQLHTDLWKSSAQIPRNQRTLLSQWCRSCQCCFKTSRWETGKAGSGACLVTSAILGAQIISAVVCFV
jgi:hypothetical protein